MQPISKIVSGGQTGVDRAALDFALFHHISYGGWCPKGGLAEDYPSSPGLLVKYNHLKETSSIDTTERTILNVRDSDATLIILAVQDPSFSPGTKLTIETAKEFHKSFFIFNLDNSFSIKDFKSFLTSINDFGSLNIAGPRESESPNIYFKTLEFLNQNICYFKSY